MRKLVFLIVAQFLELFSFLKPLNPNQVILNSTENRNFNFNSKYLFLYLLQNPTGLKPLFVINDPRLKKALEAEYGEFFISSHSLKGLYIISQAKFWVSSVLETPYIPFPICKNPKRVIMHLGHGVPLKRIVLDEEKISLLKTINRYIRSRIFNYVNSYSKEFSPIMERAFKNKNIEYLHLGQPRNDALQFYSKAQQLEKIKEIYGSLPEHKQAVLYAPTWRSYDIVKFFPFTGMTAQELNSHLIENETVLFLRKHPYFPSLLDDEYLSQSHIFLFDSGDFPEIMDYMSYFCKLITDYSSIFLDYLCLNRPVAFIPYDLELYKKHTGFTFDYEDLTPGPYLSTQEEFYSFIQDSNDHFESERIKVSKLINAKASGNCEEIYLTISEL